MNKLVVEFQKKQTCVLNAHKTLDKYALNTYNIIIKKKGGYIFETS